MPQTQNLARHLFLHGYPQGSRSLPELCIHSPMEACGRPRGIQGKREMGREKMLVQQVGRGLAPPQGSWSVWFPKLRTGWGRGHV